MITWLKRLLGVDNYSTTEAIPMPSPSTPQPLLPHVPVVTNLRVKEDRFAMQEELIKRAAMAFAQGWRHNHNIPQTEYVILYITSDQWFELMRWKGTGGMKYGDTMIAYHDAKVIFKLKPSPEEELRAWKEEVDDQ